MPYSSHHDLSPYYSDGVNNGNLSSTNSNSNSSLNSSPPPPPSLHLPHLQHQHHHHQQQHQHQYKSSPDSSLSPSSTLAIVASSSTSSSLSPMSVSPASVYLGAMTSSVTPSFSATVFAPADDVDMQPLDLSRRPARDDPASSKRARLTTDHKPVCLVKSCICNLGNTRAQRLSPYPTLAPGMSRSPNPRLGTSPLSRTGSPFYPQRQTPSPAYYSGVTASPLYYIPPPQPSLSIASSTSTENSSFQILTSSDSVLNGTHNPPVLFRPYDDHIDPNIHSTNSSSGNDSHEPQISEEEEEPTYMDLDSANTRSLYPKLNTKERTGSDCNTTSIYNEQNIPNGSPQQLRDDKLKADLTSDHQREAPMSLASSNTRDGCDYPEMKVSSYYTGSVISHTAGTEKIHSSRGVATSTYTGRESVSSEIADHHSQLKQQLQQQYHHQQQQQQQQHPSQMYHPDSSSPTGGVSSSTGHVTTLSVYPSSAQQLQHQSFHFDNSGTQQSHAISMTAEGGRFPADQASEPQPGDSQSSASTSSNTVGRHSPSNKENATNTSSSNGSIKSKKYATSSNFFQLPATTMGPDNNGTAANCNNKHRRKGEHRNSPTSSSASQQQQQQPSSGVGEDNNEEDATKISLIDYWISKILMERSAIERTAMEMKPPPNKPCNVDYIRTVNGEKKIRLRLVDLIELQVEQSLKA